MIMYKGLQLQPTFIFTECSDVTEVFVTEPDMLATSSGTNYKKGVRGNFKMEPIYSCRTDEEQPPRLSASATSIMKRPSSALMRHSPLLEYEQKIPDSNRHLYYELNEKDRNRSRGHKSRSSSRTQLKILRDLAEAKLKRERRTEEEFLQFAKEFARNCRLRPTDNLLNPVQYDSYLRNSPVQITQPPGFSYLNKYDSIHSRFPFVCSSSLIGSNNDDALEVAGHVVGDLLSFTSNTAKYFMNFVIATLQPQLKAGFH